MRAAMRTFSTASTMSRFQPTLARKFSSPPERTIVVFPGANAIMTSLQQHPRTSDPYLMEKKIIRTVAKHFEGQEREINSIDRGVKFVVVDLMDELDLPAQLSKDICQNLVAGLKDCAYRRC